MMLAAFTWSLLASFHWDKLSRHPWIPKEISPLPTQTNFWVLTFSLFPFISSFTIALSSYSLIEFSCGGNTIQAGGSLPNPSLATELSRTKLSFTSFYQCPWSNSSNQPVLSPLCSSLDPTVTWGRGDSSDTAAGIVWSATQSLLEFHFPCRLATRIHLSSILCSGVIFACNYTRVWQYFIVNIKYCHLNPQS